MENIYQYWEWLLYTSNLFNKNDLLMQRIRTVNNISNIILSVFDSNNRLIFKRNRKGILVKIRFVKRKEKFAIEQSINTNN